MPLIGLLIETQRHYICPPMILLSVTPFSETILIQKIYHWKNHTFDERYFSQKLFEKAGKILTHVIHSFLLIFLKSGIFLAKFKHGGKEVDTIFILKQKSSENASVFLLIIFPGISQLLAFFSISQYTNKSQFCSANYTVFIRRPNDFG